MTKIIYGVTVAALALGVIGLIYIEPAVAPVSTEDDELVANVPDDEPGTVCTMDAKMCPDGSGVGRSGPDCAFAACPGEPVPADMQAFIEAKSDFIKVGTPAPGNNIISSLTIAGQARGMWFFEASFPVALVNWDGLIIAEGFVTADDEWMTEEFVPFSGELDFTSPYNASDPDFMRRGTLILQRNNASGLPEHDDAVEIPVTFVANGA